MEQEFQQQPPQLEPNSNKRVFIAVVISVLVTALVVGFGVYFLVNKSTNQQGQIGDNQNTETEATSNNGNQASTENNLAAKKIYFANGWQGEYSLVNLDTGTTQDFIPAGYEIVNQHEYDPLPRFLILQKGNQLFSYEIENQLLNEIFTFNDLLLKENERVRIYPSITEKDKFYLIVTTHDLSQVSEFDGSSPVTDTRTYTFDASINKLVRTSNAKLSGCAEYDSKNQRFFSWPCGEGIGSSIPLSILDLNGTKQREVISLSEFGLEPNNLGPVAVEYNNGLFFALSKGAVNKILLVDPAPQEPRKETYTITNEVATQIKDKSYPYSTTVVKSQNTFIIGGNHFITLLRFSGNQIAESKTIPEQGLYANFIFPHDDMLYYQSRSTKVIRAIDLKSWQVVKTFPIETSEEITLVGLPE